MKTNDEFLMTLGGVVAFERKDGGMALSSWFGDTVTVWARYDINPHSVPITELRQHIVEAIPKSRGDSRPDDGFWEAICFTTESKT